MTQRETELKVLGHMLYNDECVCDIMESVSADHFTYEDTRTYFNAMKYLYKDGMPIDPVTVQDMVRKMGKVPPTMLTDIQDMLDMVNPKASVHALSAKAQMDTTPVKK